MPQIFLHHVGHGHAQCGRKILRGHGLLLVGILQKLHHAIRQSLGVSRRKEVDRQFFSHGHLPEVGQIGGNDRHPVSTGQVRHSAATGGRRIGHHCNTRALE